MHEGNFTALNMLIRKQILETSQPFKYVNQVFNSHNELGVIEVVLALTKLFFKNTNIAKSLASTIKKTSKSRDVGECTLTTD